LRLLNAVAALIADEYESDGLMMLVEPTGKSAELRMWPSEEPGKFVVSFP
jgi:hypothetical protein